MTEAKSSALQEIKYYDHAHDCPIDLACDGCNLAEWHDRRGTARFAHHPDGFKVFLAAEKLEACDECAESDPYSVEQNIDSEFHRRRITLTVELTLKAVAEVRGTPRILDLGCGQGHITDAIRRQVGVAEFSGLDYSLSAIKYAHAHFPDIEFCVGDAYEAPYARDYFDVVVCNNLWEHVPDPLRLLSRITEFLKPAGYVIMSTPSRYRVANLARAIMGRPVAFQSTYHVTEYTVGQVIEQLRFGGFEVEAICSRPISLRDWKSRIARRLFAAWLALVGSHHQLESTAFYLARKRSTTSARRSSPD